MPVFSKASWKCSGRSAIPERTAKSEAQRRERRPETSEKEPPSNLSQKHLLLARMGSGRRLHSYFSMRGLAREVLQTVADWERAKQLYSYARSMGYSRGALRTRCEVAFSSEEPWRVTHVADPKRSGAVPCFSTDLQVFGKVRHSTRDGAEVKGSVGNEAPKRS
jgi:hypothetical protein